MMKKTQVLKYIIYVIVLAVINMLYYGIWGIHHSASAWISYGFIHLAAVLVIATPFFVEKGRESYQYSAVLYAVSGIYLPVEFICGGIFIVWQPEDYKAALFSQLIILAVFLAAYLVNMIANVHTAEAVAKQEADIKYVKECSSVLKSLLKQIDNRKTYRMIEKAYDIINSSPVKSKPNVHTLEIQITDEVDSLCSAVINKNEEEIIACAEKIIRLANERNRLLRI